MERKNPEKLTQTLSNEKYMLKLIETLDKTIEFYKENATHMKADNERLKGELRKYKELYLFRFN